MRAKERKSFKFLQTLTNIQSLLCRFSFLFVVLLDCFHFIFTNFVRTVGSFVFLHLKARNQSEIALFESREIVAIYRHEYVLIAVLVLVLVSFLLYEYKNNWTMNIIIMFIVDAVY